jgi:predicted transcriptional regulator
MIRNAKKYVWILTDQVLASTIPLLSEAVGRGIEFRLILPRNPTVPASVVEMCTKDPALIRAGQKGLAQSKFIESVDAVISVSEREVGILSFPTLDGKLDYRGFYSTNDAPRSWCTNLFSRYWTESSTEIPASLS